LWLGVLLIAPLAGAGIYIALSFFRADRLRSAVAEADRLDPGWRIQDLEAARKPVADDQNAALVLIHSRTLLPKRWPSYESPGSQSPYSREESERLKRMLSEEAPPQELLPADAVAALRQEVQAARAYLDESRRVLKLSRGRNPLIYDKNWYDANLDASQRLRYTAQVFRLEAMLQIQENDLPGSLESARAIMHIARVTGDEPFLVSMLIRMAIRRTALRTIERTLAQGEPAPSTLAALQQAWQEESEFPLYLTGIRGMRGTSYALIAAVKNRSITLVELQNELDLMRFPKWTKEYISLAELYYLEPLQTHVQATVLQFQNWQVEVAKLPPEEQVKQWPALAAAQQQLPWIGRMLTEASLRVADAFVAHLAQVRCLIVALAAERYRQAHGRWPVELEDMVPEFLSAPLLDPFTAKPLIMRRTSDGLIIYSVSLDGEDNGGNLVPNYRAPGSDVGVRLWDPAKRRQPAGQSEPNE
jgi:hypothetical protein